MRAFGTRAVVCVAAAAAVMLAVAGCGSSSSTADSDSGGGGDSGALNIVASTNVWGSIAKQIGGSKVSVTSLITDPAQDPHSFEASTKNLLQISKASLVIANGGGYDDFVNRMVSSSKNKNVTTLDAVKISGKSAPAGGELNEHVWYDFPTVDRVIDRISGTLGSKLPSGAAMFKANGSKLKSQIATMQAQQKMISGTARGKGAAITEPVPLYLLQACGLQNRTPEAFSEAIENGTDVPARVLQQTLQLFSQKEVAVLAYNSQTSGPTTQQVLNAAKTHGVPVVPVTETLPQGKTYVSWMTGNLNAIKAAVGK